ncbi:MAG: recombination regulator RecX [Leptolyngbya sp. UWPOB_LEPTO1]|uniref:recombination regulator RecX n=1 Tax=Leptolyngbya sp. UWPOB_LEPTO1 TaxID=2815653 RepID=UPI001AD503A9|nr:recombination regulator RecX [Leptolyngbya sp. UWPOB_LEPTO1]MBN8564357.1 recombination regulator RecX [Leptolyngbya sp. UWPOB_LEPTO1]
MSHEIEPPADEAPAPRKRRRPELTPQQRALGLLVRREHSRKELARKLTARGIEDEDAQAAVARMTAEGWQSDERFAEQLVRSRANNGYGPVRIRAELGTHGLDRDAVAAAMDGYDGDWAANARDLVRRRFPRGTDDLAQRRKAADFLARRGFGGDQIRAAVRFDADED